MSRDAIEFFKILARTTFGSSVSHKDEGKANLLKIIIERSNEPTRTSHVRSYAKSVDRKRGTFLSRFLSVASHDVSRLINKEGNEIRSLAFRGHFARG